MDFERVLKALLSGFETSRIRYGVIGGFALGLLGVPRATIDFDILVHHDDLERLHGLLSALGYERFALTDNVSHYSHRDSGWGRIDVLHAFRTYALSMLDRAQAHPIFAGRRTIKVLEPEDVIGFKVQALANNPTRRKKEEVDIEALMARLGGRLDWNRIQEYYDLFDLGEEARQLRARFDHAE